MTKKSERHKIKMMFGGKCAYCGSELGDSFHVDHVKAIFRNYHGAGTVRHAHLDNPENKFPACAPCNIFKSTFDIEEFRSEIQLQIERVNRYSSNYRVAKRFGLVEEIKKPVVFWFEYYLELK